MFVARWADLSRRDQPNIIGIYYEYFEAELACEMYAHDDPEGRFNCKGIMYPIDWDEERGEAGELISNPDIVFNIMEV